MKIKPKDLAYMINELRKIDFAKLHSEILTDGRYKDFNKRFRWDAARKAGLITFITQTLYEYMDDSHVDTALRTSIKHL